jgi:hypothetical protein
MQAEIEIKSGSHLEKVEMKTEKQSRWTGSSVSSMEYMNIYEQIFNNLTRPNSTLPPKKMKKTQNY